MDDKIINFFISYFFIPGLFFGIKIATGMDVSETGIVLTVIKSLCGTTGISTICNMVWTYNLIFTIVFLLPFIFVLSTKNLLILITSILFFVSGVLIVIYQHLGVIVFIAAIFLSIFLKNVHFSFGGTP